MNNETVIIDSLRSPIGKYRGHLSGLSSVELGAQVVSALLSRHPQVGPEVDQLLVGSVVTAGQGQNIARQIGVRAGLPLSVPAISLNEVCGSGMKAASLGRQSIQLGEAAVVVAAGVEVMSNTPVVGQGADGQPQRAFLTDGLLDAFSGEPMGLAVEALAREYQISRQQMDVFALRSHQKAVAAQRAGRFASEIVPIGRLSRDEGVRPDTSVEKLAALPTVFLADGQLTAGNSSPVSDGGAALLLAARSYADSRGLDWLALLRESVEVGVEPERMGISPILAIRRLLDKTGLSLGDIDLFEINEAFAASSLIVEAELGIPAERVNLYGGALALGHPLGATGCRLVGSLARQLAVEGKRYGIASLCIGGGMGMAVLLENPRV